MTFQEERAEFFRALESRGMTREHANYCVTIAKRLRHIYALSQQVEALEHEELCKLRKVLQRMPTVRSVDRREEVYWDCICGGLHEGDSTVLYIVPPDEEPIAVPVPPVHDARAQDNEIRDVIESAMLDLASKLGWSSELIASSAFEEFVRATVNAEQCKRAGDQYGYEMNRERGKFVCSVLKMQHYAQHGHQQPRQFEWQGRIVQVTDEYLKQPKSGTQEHGYKQLQEISEREKRRGRYAK